MKTLYIECNMGAAGDMLMSALSELLPDPDKFMEKLNGAGIPNVKAERERVRKCGIFGTHIKVTAYGETEDEHMHEHHHEHHHHSSMNDIKHIISHLNVSENVKKNVLDVYRLIAEAEGHAHGCETEQIHFHEVGAMDAVADITGVCMLLEELAPEKIVVSPINTGHGQVRCAHGILPVPAPAAAYILKGVPVYSNEICGELCTPTGAALLRHFADEFSRMPVMSISAEGYGMGTKDFEAANCLRVFLGETQSAADEISELCCNLDDMTAEAIGYAFEKLFESGALDVFTVPAGMKKNRPAVLLFCICRKADREKMLKLIFKHTSTIGVREYICQRYTLSRRETMLHTNYGEVRAKESSGFGAKKIKPEYDDLARLADENNIPLKDIKIDE